jgi:transposase
MNDNTPESIIPEVPAAWIGWDWADDHHDIFLETAEGKTERIRLSHRPEELHRWLKELGQRFKQRKVVLCVEACRSALLPILIQYSFLELYPINPKSLARFREVVRPSGSKNDDLDCELACQLVKSHRSLLFQYVAEDSLTIELDQLVSFRRDLVNQRSAVANHLKDTLKAYYPLALELLQDDTTTALAANFVLKFPTLRAVQETALHLVRKFFLGQGCRLTEKMEERLAKVAKSVDISKEASWNNPNSFMACALAQQLKSLVASVNSINEQIKIVADQHPNRALAESLPGAAAVLEPRIMAVLGTNFAALDSAQELAVRDGVAPRRIQSGKSCVISRRQAKPQFEHQTWIEFAKSSLLTCAWAQEFVEAKKKQGKKYYTTIRALAFKWIRIVYACWKNGTVYNEATYLASLKKASSPYAPKTSAS